ncbi:MAG: hypothetical protein U7123_26550 [Potamolinea sp.]
MRKFSQKILSVVAAFILFTTAISGTFISLVPSALAEAEVRALPPGTSNYIVLTWPGSNESFLLDVENGNVIPGARVIGFPANQGGTSNQMWDVQTANRGIPSPIYAFRDPGGRNLLGLSIDNNNNLVSTLIAPNTVVPNTALWTLQGGRLINQQLAKQNPNVNFVLTPQNRVGNIVPLRFVTEQPVINSEINSVAPGQ